MMTARMISMTSTGGEVGFTPKATTRISSPTAPQRPRPTPLERAPIQMAASTTTNCSAMEIVIPPPPGEDSCLPPHCSNLGLMRFSNEKTSSHFCWVRSFRSFTTMSCRLLPVS